MNVYESLSMNAHEVFELCIFPRTLQALILAVVTDAIRSLDEEDDQKVQELLEKGLLQLTNPRGGFTDVGLHTGLHTIV